MYQKQKDRILSGGLNLLAPADKLDAGEAVVLENWRVDKAGKLESRRGVNPQSANLGAEVHSLFRFGLDRYAVAGGTLRKGTALEFTVASGFDGSPVRFAAANDFVWAMNRGKQIKVEGANASAWTISAPTSAPSPSPGAERFSVLANFDEGEPWASYKFEGDSFTEDPTFTNVLTSQGTVAATNGSSTLVGTGTDFTSEMVGADIIITGPNFETRTAIATYISATSVTIVGAYTDVTDSGLSFRVERSNPAKTFETVNKQQGTHSLRLELNPAGRWQLRSEGFSANLFVDGAALDDDVLEIWAFATNPAAISGIRIELLAREGVSGFRSAVADINPNQLSQGSFSWTKMKIRRRLDAASIIASNQELSDLQAEITAAEERGDSEQAATLRRTLDGLYQEALDRTPYFRSEGDFDWSRVYGVVIDMTAAEACEMNWDYARMVGGPQASLEGEFIYAVTFDNDYGHESSLGVPSSSVTVTKQGVSLANIPTSPDPQVTARHIYRLGGGSGRWLRVATISDNVTTTASDFTSMTTAQDLNIEPLTDVDPPPAASGVVGPYLGRLIAWSTAAHPNRLFWSMTAQPWRWPGSADEEVGNWIDVGDAREAILAVTMHRRMLVIYKERSIWRLLGDPEEQDPEQTNATAGILGPLACVAVGGVDYYAGTEGVFRFNGDFEEKLSLPVDPIFKGEYSDTVVGFAEPLNVDAAAKVVLGQAAGRLWVSYPAGGSAVNSKTLVYNISAGAWSSHSGGFTAMNYEGPTNYLIAAAGGVVVELEAGDTDGGAAIPVTYQSRLMDQGINDSPKVYSDVVVDFATAFASQTPATLSVSLILDDGTQFVLGTISSSRRTRKAFPLLLGKGVSAYSAAVRIEGTTSATVTIHAIYLHFYPEERLGRSFDTGVMDLGTFQWKEFREVEVEISTTLAVSVTIQTDASGAMADAATATITHVDGRRVVQFPIVAEGRRVRLIFHSSEAFRVFGIRLRVLPVGEYIDGAKGDIWESEPIPL